MIIDCINVSTWAESLMQVLKEISDQFQLCASVMSDPLLMREQPATVARQFNAVVPKIEMLRQYLVRPVREGERIDHWMDASIIDAGIRRLVVLTLKSHMAPLLGEALLPEVFKEWLNREVEEVYGSENLVIREIKEVNCTASLVLLYYYLAWHLMLIRINVAAYPCQKDTKSPWETDDDFASFMNSLPNERQILETRNVEHEHNDNVTEKREVDNVKKGGRTKRFVTGDGIVKKVPVASGEEERENNSGKGGGRGFEAGVMTDAAITGETSQSTRLTNLISVYRTVIHNVRYDKSNPEDVWWILKQREEGEENFDETAISACHATVAMKMMLEAIMFQGVRSMFNLQGDIRKWKDMCSDFEIRSDDIEKDDDDIRTIKPKEALYRSKLIDILFEMPYCQPENVDTRKAIFQFCSIHDYGSTTIMMDICISLMKMYRLMKVQSAELEKHMLLFITQSLYKEHPYREFINGLRAKTGNLSEQHKAKFISDTLGSFKKAITLNQATFSTIAVDQLAGYYWGSKPDDTENVNHQYLATTDLDGSGGFISIMYKLQKACLTPQKDVPMICISILQPMLRNSLFVTTFSDSAIKLLERMKCHRLFQDTSYSCKLNDDDQAKNDIALLRALSNGAEHESSDDNLIPGGPPNPEPRRLSHKTVLGFIKFERAELQRYTSSLRDFTKYPGFSWPVFDADKRLNNFESFTWVRNITKSSPPIRDSVYILASRANDAATLFEARERREAGGRDREQALRDEEGRRDGEHGGDGGQGGPDGGGLRQDVADMRQA